MNYVDALAEIATEHTEEIEQALAAAHSDLALAGQAFETARRRVVHLECLLTLSEPGKGPKAEEPRSLEVSGETDGPMTLHAAMRRVLLDAPGHKLRAGEIIAEIDRRGLYRMRDGRLPESQQIHARAGHYPDLIGKDGPLFYPK